MSKLKYVFNCFISKIVSRCCQIISLGKDSFHSFHNIIFNARVLSLVIHSRDLRGIHIWLLLSTWSTVRSLHLIQYWPTRMSLHGIFWGMGASSLNAAYKWWHWHMRYHYKRLEFCSHCNCSGLAFCNFVVYQHILSIEFQNIYFHYFTLRQAKYMHLFQLWTSPPIYVTAHYWLSLGQTLDSLIEG